MDSRIIGRKSMSIVLMVVLFSYIVRGLFGCFLCVFICVFRNKISFINIISCKDNIVVWFKLNVLYFIKIIWVKVLKFMMVGVLKLDNVYSIVSRVFVVMLLMIFGNIRC